MNLISNSIEIVEYMMNYLMTKLKVLGYRVLIAVFLVLIAEKAFPQSAKLKVVASASMITDMAQQIAGDLIEIETIVPIGGDPHIHEPTPRDARLVAAADLVFINGLTFEGWINELIENSGTKAITVLVTEGVVPLTSLSYKNSSDPHAWMDVSNGIVYSRNITNALKSKLPNHAETLEIAFNNYAERLQDLDTYIKNEIQKIPSQQRILITSHDAFQYYGKRYGIRLEAIMGISTEADAQTSDLIRVIKAIEDNKVPALFIESTINPKLMEQIARDAKVAIGGKLYADSLGDKDSPAPSYWDMLKYNTDTIVAALSQPVEEHMIPDSPLKLRHIYILAATMGFGLLIVLILFNKK